MSPVTLEQARAAKEAALELFTRIGSVAGVGITRVGGDYAVKVNLKAPLPDGTAIPAAVGGVPVHVEIVGVIRPR